MQHANLVGKYDLSIDEKHRLLIPSEVRRELKPERDGQAFYVVVGENGKAWLYTELYFDGLASQMRQTILPGQDRLAFDQWFFSNARKLECDKQGRVLIPESTLKRTGTSRQVSLIGCRDHLEIWNRADWEAHDIALSARMQEILQRARESMAAERAGN